jgi:hypothetical protein
MKRACRGHVGQEKRYAERVVGTSFADFKIAGALGIREKGAPLTRNISCLSGSRQQDQENCRGSRFIFEGPVQGHQNGDIAFGGAAPSARSLSSYENGLTDPTGAKKRMVNLSRLWLGDRNHRGNCRSNITRPWK